MSGSEELFYDESLNGRMVVYRGVGVGAVQLCTLTVQPIPPFRISVPLYVLVGMYVGPSPPLARPSQPCVHRRPFNRRVWCGNMVGRPRRSGGGMVRELRDNLNSGLHDLAPSRVYDTGVRSMRSRNKT